MTMSASPNANGDHRPSKRQRAQGPEELNPGPVDHIFIADGVSAKKAGVKKVRRRCFEFSASARCDTAIDSIVVLRVPTVSERHGFVAPIS